jgi:hypothetical protein
VTSSSRIAVVTATWGDRWREEDVITARVAGALACGADVDVLIGDSSGGPVEEVEGALRLLRFPAVPRARSRRASLARLVLGREGSGDPAFCRCLESLASVVVEGVPRTAQRELVSCEGGHAPELFEYLRSAGYDAILFAGLRFASTVFGVEAAPPHTRLAMLPLVGRLPTLHLPIYREALARMDRLLTLTPGESRRVVDLGGDAGRVHEIGFAARVSEVATRSEPAAPSTEGLLAVVRDWTRGSLRWRLRREAIALRTLVPDVRICLIGRGAERFADDRWTVARQVSSRVDVWRWTSRAVALLEPEADRLFSLEAVEAMMYGTPVIARADSGAAREHAELGDGGLWYRSLGELRAAVSALRDPDLRSTIGAQARRYALDRYGQPEAFIRRVTQAVSGPAAS